MASEIISRFIEANDCLTQRDRLNALYNREGYLFFRDVLNKDEVRRAKEDFMRVLKRQGAIVPDENEPLWSGCPIDQIDDNALYALSSYQELCESPTTVQLLEQVFGEPVFVYRNTSVRYSLPQDDVHTTPSHQDHYFIGPNSDFRTVWIPLMEIDKEVGGLCIAAGSHVRGVREHVEDEKYESYILKGRKQKGIPLETIGEPWVTTDYRPGDVVIFNSSTIHRSLTNRSRMVRLSVDARAQPATTPRSFQASNSIPELRHHRVEVQRLATEEGASREEFEVIVLHMIKNGLRPERTLIKRLHQQVRAGITQLF
jgi:1-deoxypentalenic acid 11beta-hydroxylase